MATRFLAGSLVPHEIVTPADVLGKSSPVVPADCTGCDHSGYARRTEAWRYLCETCLRAIHGAALHPPIADPPGRPFVHRARNHSDSTATIEPWPKPIDVCDISLPLLVDKAFAIKYTRILVQRALADGWTARARAATVTLPFRGKPEKIGELLSVLLNRREAWRIINWTDGSFSGAKVWGDIHPTIVTAWAEIKGLMA